MSASEPAEEAAEKVEKQIPRRPEGLLVMTNKRLATAQLKLRPFKTFRNRLFQQPLKPAQKR
jgi:hypothetical protein